MPFGWQLRGDIQQVLARSFHHPPVAVAKMSCLFVPISVVLAKLAGKWLKNKENMR